MAAKLTFDNKQKFYQFLPMILHDLIIDPDQIADKELKDFYEQMGARGIKSMLQAYVLQNAKIKIDLKRFKSQNSVVINISDKLAKEPAADKETDKIMSIAKKAIQKLFKGKRINENEHQILSGLFDAEWEIPNSEDVRTCEKYLSSASKGIF